MGYGLPTGSGSGGLRQWTAKPEQLKAGDRGRGGDIDRLLDRRTWLIPPAAVDRD